MVGWVCDFTQQFNFFIMPWLRKNSQLTAIMSALFSCYCTSYFVHLLLPVFRLLFVLILAPCLPLDCGRRFYRYSTSRERERERERGRKFEAFLRTSIYLAPRVRDDVDIDDEGEYLGQRISPSLLLPSLDEHDRAISRRLSLLVLSPLFYFFYFSSTWIYVLPKGSGKWHEKRWVLVGLASSLSAKHRLPCGDKQRESSYARTCICFSPAVYFRAKAPEDYNMSVPDRVSVIQKFNSIPEPRNIQR